MRRILGVLATLSILISLVYLVHVAPAGAMSRTQDNIPS